MDLINLKDKLEKIEEVFSPKIIAEMNDEYFKLAKLHGEFTWHSHNNTDEVFIVLNGSLEIHFEDNVKRINEGEMIVIPKNVVHKPIAKELCSVLLIEQKDTLNTGDKINNLTVEKLDWI